MSVSALQSKFSWWGSGFCPQLETNPPNVTMKTRSPRYQVNKKKWTYLLLHWPISSHLLPSTNEVSLMYAYSLSVHVCVHACWCVSSCLCAYDLHYPALLWLQSPLGFLTQEPRGGQQGFHT